MSDSRDTLPITKHLHLPKALADRIGRPGGTPQGYLLWSVKYDYNVGMADSRILSSERSVPAGEFKAHCLRLMDDVQETGTAIVVTKHRRPVVRVSPFRDDRPQLVGSCVGQLRIIADIDEDPAIPLDDWDMINDLGGSETGDPV